MNAKLKNENLDLDLDQGGGGIMMMILTMGVEMMMEMMIWGCDCDCGGCGDCGGKIQYRGRWARWGIVLTVGLWVFWVLGDGDEGRDW